MFCLKYKNPKFKLSILIEDTIAETPGGVWCKAFDWACANGMGDLLATNYDGMENETCPPAKSKYVVRRYWKKAAQFRAFAKRCGFSVVEVTLVEKQ